jgi:hypothetical protein
MPEDKPILSGWRCDSCGETISNLNAGWVEWLASADEQEMAKASGLQLVHSERDSTRGSAPHGCRYEQRDEFRKNRKIVEGLPLERFVGLDGLVLILSLIAEHELPTEELLELTRRVQIPGYEQARGLFERALSEGVVMPAIAPGYYLQCEVQDVLEWAMRKVE